MVVRRGCAAPTLDELRAHVARTLDVTAAPASCTSSTRCRCAESARSTGKRWPAGWVAANRLGGRECRSPRDGRGRDRPGPGCGRVRAARAHCGSSPCATRRQNGSPPMPGRHRYPAGGNPHRLGYRSGGSHRASRRRLGPVVARRLRWRVLPLVAWATAGAWAFALAMIDGWQRGFAARLTDKNEYLRQVPTITDIPEALRTFSSRILDFQPNSWITHVSGHPPGALLTFVWLDRLGLGGGAWAGLLCLLAGRARRPR
ncbi:acyl-CoA synthetase domain protein [Mycobacterium xenopi 4042]|uniref:Acyl-CoA synthetase domain protein n=1 Tax=Mycobacterium xenopi 4042 TaxID=1299334 RepID=X8C7S3_MYCXE|nr:acyl-CoA synthetase domain protein [Mycobacterium xenopi 4042]